MRTNQEKENKTPELESFGNGDLVCLEIYYPETLSYPERMKHQRILHGVIIDDSYNVNRKNFSIDARLQANWRILITYDSRELNSQVGCFINYSHIWVRNNLRQGNIKLISKGISEKALTSLLL
jgi:hypothetical protein